MSKNSLVNIFAANAQQKQVLVWKLNRNVQRCNNMGPRWKMSQWHWTKQRLMPGATPFLMKTIVWHVPGQTQHCNPKASHAASAVKATPWLQLNITMNIVPCGQTNNHNPKSIRIEPTTSYLLHVCKWILMHGNICLIHKGSGKGFLMTQHSETLLTIGNPQLHASNPSSCIESLLAFLQNCLKCFVVRVGLDLGCLLFFWWTAHSVLFSFTTHKWNPHVMMQVSQSCWSFGVGTELNWVTKGQSC